MIQIRRETPPDVDRIRAVNDAAFGQPTEGQLVDALRNVADPFISFVAEDDGEIVGHILFTPVEVEREDGSRMLIAGLAPMSVVSARQKQHIGSKLVEAGLEECRRAGFRAVVVLGHPDYYPLFGFEPAARRGLSCEYDVPEPVFMVLTFEPVELSGVARYHPVFRDFE